MPLFGERCHVPDLEISLTANIPLCCSYSLSSRSGSKLHYEVSDVRVSAPELLMLGEKLPMTPRTTR